MFGELNPKVPRALDFLRRQIRGALPISNGGTGLASLTAHGLMVGNGTGAPSFLAPGSNGNVATSNGTDWVSSPLAPAGLTLLSSQTISSSTASVSDTTHITNAYSHYIWEISNLVSVTNDVDAYITVQQGGSFLGSTDYSYYGFFSDGVGLSGYSSGGAAQFNVTGAHGGIGTGAPSVIRFEFWNPAIAANLAVLFETMGGSDNHSLAALYKAAGSVQNAAATTGIKLGMSSGNIASCTANLYGVT